MAVLSSTSDWPTISLHLPRTQAQFSHQHVRGWVVHNCIYLFVQPRAPGRDLGWGGGGGQFPWQIKAVGGRPNVFAGRTHLIPEHRSDTLGTKMGPHRQTSQTRSPGASKKAPRHPHLPVHVWWLGGGGMLRSLERAKTQSDFCLLKMGQQREPTLRGWGGVEWGRLPQQWRWWGGLYLTTLGIVGTVAQEHFQCAAKADGDFNFLLRLQRELPAHFSSFAPPPQPSPTPPLPNTHTNTHTHSQQRNKEISIV